MMKLRWLWAPKRDSSLLHGQREVTGAFTPRTKSKPSESEALKEQVSP